MMAETLAVKQGVLLYVLLWFVTVHGQNQPTIQTASGTHHSKVGGIVSLPCVAENLGTYKLNWIFVTHNTLIFHDGQLMVDDDKYVQQHAPDSDRYSLQINQAKIEDQGVYKCEIEGTNQAITLNLILEGAPTPPDLNEEREPLNRTSCCKEKGISEECLPVCHPSTASGLSDFILACESDLLDLIYCGSDGRNHGDCCARSQVPARCLKFCSNDQEQLNHLTTDDLVCLNSTDRIISCYEYGGALLPSPPQSLSVITVSRNGTYKLQITWNPPKYNPSAVSGYRVFYKSGAQSKFRAKGVQSAASNTYSLPVNVNTAYSIYVVAVAHHGSSQPTNIIDIVVEDTSPPGHATDVLACCQVRDVPPKCQTMLCHPRLWSHFNVTNVVECYLYLNDIFTCLNGERNNSGCCVVNNVPPLCVGMCSGRPPPFNNTLAACIPRLSVIEACVQDGLSYQPRAPQSVTLMEVAAHHAVVTWAPSNDSSVSAYYVQLRRGNENASWNTVEEIVGSFVDLTNLTETENYAVRVIAISVNSSSLPSAVVRFTTYPETQEVERPTIAHNITQCCEDTGMPTVCSQGCHYAEDVTSYYGNPNVLVVCLDYIGTILSCATDGRNHTSCCRKRNVQEQCYELCSYNTPGGLDPKFLSCIDDTASIVQCYEEGLVDLVRTPEELEVTNLTSHTITIKWKNPETGPKPEKYQVDYTNLSNNKKYKKTTTGLMYILQNLVPGTSYSVSVSSLLNGTSSPPTPLLTLFTPALDSERPFLPHPPTNTSRALWTNRTHCCQSSSISKPCQAVCMNRPATNATDCSTENHNILICAADGRDHTLCCQENGLPHECLPLCGSHAATNFSVQLAGCLADATLSIITSCFLSNTGLLPSVPYHFKARNMEGSQVILEWSTASNCDNDNCSYDIHYWPAANKDPSNYTTIFNASSPFSLKTLTPNRWYTFTVTARNPKGSGPPAPWVTIFFGDEYPEISIAQTPKLDVLEQGSTVYLTCDAYNLQGAPKFTWRFRNRILPTSGRVLRLTKVNSRSEGTYNCTVTSGDISISADTYVNVRFQPKFAYFRTDTVRPNEGQEAVLACWFRGHPNTSDRYGVWTKDGKPLPYGSSRHSASVTSRYHTGITAFKVKIANLEPSDYGMYRCNVSNQYGYATAHTKLMDPAKIPPPVTPTPLQAKNVSSCCQARGVIDTCMPLCSMEVSPAEAIAEPEKYGVCLLFFSEMIECAADGADHTLCCEDRGISEVCLPFCKGEVPPVTDLYNSPHLLQCVDETPDIVDCMNRGYERIPTAPLHVVASFVGSKIKVAWDPPSRNAHRVTSYDIYYNFSGNPAYQTETVTQFVGFKHALENVDPDHVYHIWMKAERYKFGISRSSNVVVVSSHAGLPMPPTGLKVVSMKGTTVVIGWNPPEFSPVSPDGYAVYYKPRNAIKEMKTLREKSEIMLKDLKENTEYEVQVASRSLNGEGPRSASLIFHTGQEGEPGPGTGPEKQSGKLSGGQIAGIVIAIVVVIAIGLLLAVLLYRSRVTKKQLTESVTFENPSYGNQQVHIGGLPGNNPYDTIMQPQAGAEKEGDFTYTRLQEDRVPTEATATKPESQADSPNTTYSTPADPGEVSVDVANDSVAKLEMSDAELKNESTT